MPQIVLRKPQNVAGPVSGDVPFVMNWFLSGCFSTPIFVQKQGITGVPRVFAEEGGS